VPSNRSTNLLLARTRTRSAPLPPITQKHTATNHHSEKGQLFKSSSLRDYVAIGFPVQTKEKYTSEKVDARRKGQKRRQMTRDEATQLMVN
jgi:hypothetical protein